VREAEIIQGRRIEAAQVEQVRQFLADHPDWSRKRLSQEVAQLWDWRNGVGRLKDMAARSLLLKLEQRGWIVLPPRRQQPVNRMQHRRMPELSWPDLPTLAGEPLAALPSLVLTEVSGPVGAKLRAVFDRLLHQYHYLSHRSTVGEKLQYLVGDEQGRPVACLLFGAAAWQCADRDRYLGWEPGLRAQHLHLLANNTRFLILPGLDWPQLASSMLSRVSRRLSRDWHDCFSLDPRFKALPREIRRAIRISTPTLRLAKHLDQFRFGSLALFDLGDFVLFKVLPRGRVANHPSDERGGEDQPERDLQFQLHLPDLVPDSLHLAFLFSNVACASRTGCRRHRTSPIRQGVLL
jgi:Domain of unknown function (DUF4338)